MEMTARGAALQALERCRRQGAWSDEVLSSIAGSASLDKRDAALAQQLCIGVLQNRALCDFYIDAFSTTKAARMEPKLLDILRISVYSLAFLDRIPARATLYEAVELCKKNGLFRASGLANAVLRRVSENRNSLPTPPGEGSAEYLSVLYSHPKWIVEAFMDRLGYTETESLLRIDNSVSPVTVQINTLRCDVDTLLRSGARPHPWLQDCVLLPPGGEGLQFVRQGFAYVQDPAARLAVIAAGPQPGMSVLDACAAPGGKSFASGIQMRNTGRILACDLHENKLGRIHSGAERLGLNIIETRAMDARRSGETLRERFDLVLADVPCSGLGVIRKKPDIRYKTFESIQTLPQLQLDILRALAGCVKPGGVLMYSTCTLLRSENEDVCSRFLSENTEFTTEPFTLPGPAGTAENGMLTLWPHLHETDGFFLCKMRKSI